MHLIQVAGISFAAFEANRAEFQENPIDSQQTFTVRQNLWQRIHTKISEIIYGLQAFRLQHLKRTEGV